MPFRKQAGMCLKFIDIGANLIDPMFRGLYYNAKKHQDDLSIVLERSWKQGLQKVIVTVGTLNEADEALKLAKQDDRLYVTMGCHPTHCRDFLKDPDEYYEGLRAKISNNLDKVVAIGECGLDYDRLHFCEKETQKVYFERQLDLAAEFRLPLFLHCRNAYSDFIEILARNRDKFNATGGVVHSFDGTMDEAEQVLAFNLKIGLNGCSLKTASNLAVVKELSNEHLLLETDCPWCSIRATHAGYKYITTNFPTVKKKNKWTADTLIDGRCEPCQIRQILEVIAGVKNEALEKLADIYYQNTLNLFFNKMQNYVKSE